MQGKILVSGDKIRQETAGEDKIQVMIVRPDKKVIWIITSGEKTFIEMPYQSAGQTFEQWTAEKEKNARLKDEETVSGLACKKYETVEDGEKKVLWIPNEFPFPIKIEDTEMVMEYENIKLGQLDDSLFEPPADYEKISAPAVSPRE